MVKKFNLTTESTSLSRFSELPLVEVHHLANLMWAIAKLGANPLDGALFQECIRQILPR